ncbi:MAG: SMP-30/gluconolactonase/LRE family protein [Pseudomonadota bacterium]
MKRYLYIFLISSFLTASVVHAETSGLEQIWQLEGLKNPESVVYDKANERLLVSNVDGGAMDMDGNGSISVVSLDGKMSNAEWVTGLNAPKGLAITGNKLYVADIDTLIEIDLTSATITNSFTVSDAKFLNDVAADDKGNIYVSDMMLNRIHRLQDGKFEIWLEGDMLENPNGLHFEEDDIMLGSWGVMTDGFATDVPGHLKRISLKDKEVSSVGDGTPIGNLDGVEGTEATGFYVTDWLNGKLLHISRDGAVTMLLDLNQGSADHEYIIEQDLILIPMMKDNLLNAYKLN